MNKTQQRIHEAALRLFAEKQTAKINIRELAQAAGVARGTIYKNLDSIESLFESVATRLAAEMNERIGKSMPIDLDPAHRLANGVRFYLRRAHEEPHWGYFLTRYSATSTSLQKLWDGPPVHDLLNGLTSQLYSFRSEQLLSAVTMIAGSVLAAITLVLGGHKTWRDAGCETAELLLSAFGVDKDKAAAIAQQKLPVLAPAPITKTLDKKAPQMTSESPARATQD